MTKAREGLDVDLRELLKGQSIIGIYYAHTYWQKAPTTKFFQNVVVSAKMKQKNQLIWRKVALYSLVNSPLYNFSKVE